MIRRVKENNELDKANKEALGFKTNEVQVVGDVDKLDLIMDKDYNKDKFNKSFRDIIDTDADYKFKDHEEKLELK